jgi:hypothetical protein
MVVGWKDARGNIVVSDRIASGRRLPDYSRNQVSKVVPLAVPAPSWAKLAFTISRPYNTDDVRIDSRSSFIYAYGDAAVGSDLANAPFQKHEDVAVLGPVDLTN